MNDIKKILEIAFLILFATIFIWAGAGRLFDHRIEHPFPWGYMASDAFQHQTRAEAIKTTGNYIYEAPYIAGGYTDVLGFYPPMLYQNGIIFSNAASIENYDGLYILVFLLAATGALVFYIIIKNYNKYAAILSLPLMILVFYKTSYTGFTWGNWPSIAGQVFLIALFWATMRINIKKIWILLGVIASAIALTHTSEAIFGALYLLLFLIATIIEHRKILSKEMKNLVCAGAIAVAASGYYLIIFQKTWAISYPFKFEVVTTYARGVPIVMPTDFGAWMYVAIAGAILAAYIANKEIKEKKTTELFDTYAGVTIGIFATVVGFGNYYGFWNRAFQIRLFWPIYLSVFIGIILHYLIKKTIKHFSAYYITAIALMIITSGIITISSIPQVQTGPAQGMMNQYHWDSLQWLKKNAPQDARVLFFNGDIYSQDAMLRNIQRNHVLTKDNPNALRELNDTYSINREINMIKVGDCCGSWYPYRKGAFEFGYHYLEAGGDANRSATGDICEYNYIVIDEVSGNPDLANQNNAIRETLLKSKNIEEVYNNRVVSIMLNKKTGGDCV